MMFIRINLVIGGGCQYLMPLIRANLIVIELLRNMLKIFGINNIILNNFLGILNKLHCHSLLSSQKKELRAI